PDWSPDGELAAFLAAGEPPIYVGFGSMPGVDPQRLTGLVVEGLRRSGKRGLLATVSGALGDVVAAAEDIQVIACAARPALSAYARHVPSRWRRDDGRRVARRQADGNLPLLRRPAVLGPPRGRS
ncbi:hypothetical protein GGQ85_004418, partial [Nitrobacter vulgaris]|nr:hypothetical protein [Nitrobacter vulgaris]